MLYENDVPTWNTVLQAYRDGHEINDVNEDALIGLCALYNLAHFRRHCDSNEHIMHFDTMLMNKGADIWTRSAEMSHWLTEQGILSRKRAKVGKRTTRVFYFNPPIERHSEILSITETVFRHVYCGIDVYLVDSRSCSSVLDCTILSTNKGILTDINSGRIAFRDAGSVSDVETGHSIFQEINRLVHSGDALHFPLNTSMQQILWSLKRFIDE